MISPSLGKLYLIPTPIADQTYNQVVPNYNQQIIHTISYFLAEDINIAAKYIKKAEHPTHFSRLYFTCIDKHFVEDIENYMQPLKEGQHIGIFSEAGCPGIADPGAIATKYAHKNDIEVIPLVGPCSILLALMASGFNGQNFTFHGYLPIDKKEKRDTIRKIEMLASQNGYTQIFIETPYRNESILETLLETCRPNTWLCIGKNITAANGWIKSKTIQDWHKNKPTLHKTPTVFLLASQ